MSEKYQPNMKPSNVAKKPATSNNSRVNFDAMKEFKDLYNIRRTMWYQSGPYGFKIYLRDDNSPLVMFLPIAPSNLTITTDFATNMIPTLYGTVEEHSDVRYYDISIEGTTGMVSQNYQPGYGEPSEVFHRDWGNRSSFAISHGISLNGFFSKTIALVNQLANKATEIANKKKEPVAGFSVNKSGYTAFHNLYRVLLKHKKDAAGISSDLERTKNQHPITFFNYKDNNEYDVVVRSFTMRRSADNPMLYYYSIQLRGYNLRNAGHKPGTKRIRMDRWGLDGVESSSNFGDIKKIANKAKSIVASIAGGINILGR